MSWNNRNCPTACMGVGLGQSGSGTSQVMSSAYTYNSAGQCWAGRFVAPTTAAISKVYFFESNKTGSPGNMTVEIRDASSASKPGSTLLASVNVAVPGSTRKWTQATGFAAHSFTLGALYFVCFGDAAGSAGNSWTLLRQGVVSADNRGAYRQISPINSSNGFTAQTVQTANAILVIVFVDGTVMGCPYTTTNSWGSGTLERGLYLGGFTSDIQLVGATWDNTIANANILKIYEGAVAPGSSPFFSQAIGTNVSTVGAMRFATIPRLKRNTVYRAVLGFSGADTGTYFEIEDPSADLLLATPGNGGVYATIDDGAGGWTQYTERLPQLTLQVADAPAIPLVGGMNGGFSL